MREEGGTITVLQDHGFEQKLVERRNAAADGLYDDWKARLAEPVKVGPDMIDLHELADLVTPDLLRSLPLEGSLTFARPNEAKSTPLPASIPNFYDRFVSRGWKGMPFSGMRVKLTSSRMYVEVTLSFAMDSREASPVYTYYFSPYADKDGAFGRNWVQPTGDLARRLEFFRYKQSDDETGWVLSTKDFDVFADRSWSNEPLNAMTAPVLINGAKTLNKNLVAFLDDAAIARNLPQYLFGLILFDDFRIEEGDWVMGQVVDPKDARERRANRQLLADLVARSRTRGHFEFWDYVEYAAKPGAASSETIKLEAAALGPVAFATCPPFVPPDLALSLHTVYRNSRLWTQLSSENGVVYRSLPKITQDHLLHSFQSSSHWLTGTPKSDDAVSAAKKLTSVQAGLDKAIPPHALVRIVSDDSDSLVGVNREREYLTWTTPAALAYSVAQNEAGKNSVSSDAFAALKEFVPCVSRDLRFEVEVDGFIFRGPGTSYSEVTEGVEPRSLDKLPQHFRELYGKALAEARRKIGGG